MSFAKSFTELRVWREAHSLVLAIYGHTDNFPAKERFGLTSQIRRSVTSVTANITEGFERGGKKEFIHFLTIARGSIAETQNHLLVARDLGYMSKEAFNKLANQAIITHKLINALIRSLKTSVPANKHTSN